jgi:hypothetical protein
VPDIDPIASFRSWSIEVAVGPYAVKVPPLPASEWLPLLMSADLLGTLELDAGFDLTDALFSGVNADDARAAAVEVVVAASGRSAWSAVALAMIAKTYWASVGADLARRGIRWDQVSLGLALDAIYGSLAAQMDEKGLTRLNATLENPPPEFGASPQVAQAPRKRVGKPLPANAEQYVQTRPKTVLRRPQDRQRGGPASTTGQPA